VARKKTLQILTVALALVFGAAPGRAANGQEAAPAPQGPPRAAAPAGAAPSAPAPSATATTGLVSLNFTGADLVEVIHVLAQYLKLNYTIDPGVRGNVTLYSAQPLRQEDLLPVFHQVLRMNGAVAVQSGDFYHIAPIKDGKGLVRPARRLGERGYILQVVPVRFFAVTEIKRLLEPFITSGGEILEFPRGNFLIILDLASNIQRLLEIKELIDVNVFAGVRMELYQTKAASAEDLALEMEKIMQAYAASVPQAETFVARFIPVPRINRLLVIAHSEAAWTYAHKWLDRIDTYAEGPGRKIFVYPVENGKARDLADILNQVLGHVSTGPRTSARSLEEMHNRVTGGQQPALPSTGQPGASTGQSGSLFAVAPAPTQAPQAGPRGAPGTAAASSPAKAEEDQVRIVPDPATNSLIVFGTSQEFQNIKNILKEIDMVPRQVLMDVLIAEITLSDDSRFGVEYEIGRKPNGVDFLDRTFGQRASILSALAGPAAAGGPGPAVLSTVIGTGNALRGFINALQSDSRVKVLSSPTILASDNQPARIQVGTEEPIATGTVTAPVSGGTTSSTTIQYRNTGRIVTVIPQVNAEGLVNLQVKAEVSQRGADVSVGGTTFPSFDTRDAETTAVVQDGDTLAIGGIITERVTRGRLGIPFLMDVPVLGRFFGTTTDEIDRTELIMLITPHVMRNRGEAQSVTEEFKERLAPLVDQFRREVESLRMEKEQQEQEREEGKSSGHSNAAVPGEEQNPGDSRQATLVLPGKAETWEQLSRKVPLTAQSRGTARGEQKVTVLSNMEKFNETVAQAAPGIDEAYGGGRRGDRAVEAPNLGQKDNFTRDLLSAVMDEAERRVRQQQEKVNAEAGVPGSSGIENAPEPLTSAGEAGRGLAPGEERPTGQISQAIPGAKTTALYSPGAGNRIALQKNAAQSSSVGEISLVEKTGSPSPIASAGAVREKPLVPLNKPLTPGHIESATLSGPPETVAQVSIDHKLDDRVRESDPIAGRDETAPATTKAPPAPSVQAVAKLPDERVTLKVEAVGASGTVERLEAQSTAKAAPSSKATAQAARLSGTAGGTPGTSLDKPHRESHLEPGTSGAAPRKILASKPSEEVLSTRVASKNLAGGENKKTTPLPSPKKAPAASKVAKTRAEAPLPAGGSGASLSASMKLGNAKGAGESTEQVETRLAPGARPGAASAGVLVPEQELPMAGGSSQTGSKDASMDIAVPPDLETLASGEPAATTPLAAGASVSGRELTLTTAAGKTVVYEKVQVPVAMGSEKEPGKKELSEMKAPTGEKGPVTVIHRAKVPKKQAPQESPLPRAKTEKEPLSAKPSTVKAPRTEKGPATVIHPAKVLKNEAPEESPLPQAKTDKEPVPAEPSTSAGADTAENPAPEPGMAMNASLSPPELSDFASTAYPHLTVVTSKSPVHERASFARKEQPAASSPRVEKSGAGEPSSGKVASRAKAEEETSGTRQVASSLKEHISSVIRPVQMAQAATDESPEVIKEVVPFGREAVKALREGHPGSGPTLEPAMTSAPASAAVAIETRPAAKEVAPPEKAAPRASAVETTPWRSSSVPSRAKVRAEGKSQLAAEKPQSTSPRAKAKTRFAEKETRVAKTNTRAGMWSVQVNAFTREAPAVSLVEKLRHDGYDAYVVKAEVKGRTWYRVRVGLFTTSKGAKEVAASLKKNKQYRQAFVTVER